MSQNSTEIEMEDAAVANARLLIGQAQFQQAESVLREAIAADPAHHAALHLLAQLACHFKRFDIAAQFATQAVQRSADVAAYHVTLGRVWRGQGQHAEALRCFDRALRLKPDQADALVLQGLTRKALGDISGAAQAYRRALEIRPDYAEAKVNLANALREQGQRLHADTLYQEAAAHAPQLAEAQSALAASLLTQGRDAEALEQYRRALALKPDQPTLQFMRGLLAHRNDYGGEAIEAYARAVEQKPDYADAWVNLGLALAAASRPMESLEAYRRALAIDPDHPEAHINYGLGLSSFGVMEEAISIMRRATELRPRSALVWSNFAAMLILDSRLVQAEAALRRAVDLDPKSVGALTNLGSTLRGPARQRESVAVLRKALELDPGHVIAHDNLMLSLLYADDVSNEEIVESARNFGASIKVAQTHPAPIPTPREGRRLRIGYVSPDLRRHSVSYFFEPLLVQHDRTQFEVFCYYLMAQEDEVTRRLTALADHWVPCSGMEAHHLAQRVRDDAIDILVDLAGHTSQHRLQAFAEQAAPVQMTWLGYPSTVGLPAIGYRITDWQVDPPGYERFNTETPLRLPHSYFCYRPGPAPEIGPLPLKQQGYLTFGSFNSLAKLSDATVELWADVLRRVPQSRLMLKNKMFAEPETMQRVQASFAAAGIAAQRLDLLAWTDSSDSHLDLYNQVDIALDTYPYNGATTTCEALWMGVPVVSRCGEKNVSRMGRSLLASCDLMELVAESNEDFVRKVIDLGSDVARLSALRAGLRERMRASPLMDEPAFGKAIEALYEQAWASALGTSSALQERA